eukprot:SAG31_NODE_4912_length_2871_cov_2.282468_3_plen_91_part_00
MRSRRVELASPEHAQQCTPPAQSRLLLSPTCSDAADAVRPAVEARKSRLAADHLACPAAAANGAQNAEAEPTDVLRWVYLFYPSRTGRKI